jgi:Protein of unknown function (DUF1186)/SEC-C motif
MDGHEPGDGNPTMTPDQIFAALAVPEGLPRDAMAAAGQHRDEMIPVLLDHITRLKRSGVESVSEEDRSAFLFVFYLLGEWRDGRTYRPLVGLLRHDPDLLDLLLGDAITEGTARIVAGVCDGDLQPIFAAIEDEAADVFVRCQMFDALVMIAHDRPLMKPAITAYIESFFLADFDKPELLWGSWAFAIADLGLAQLEPQVRQAFEREWISPQEASFSFFQEQLKEAVETGASPRFRRSHHSKPIENAIDELSGWYCFSENYQRDQAAARRREERGLSSLYSDTFLRETPKVGRNDPCPCGSGKKFKKCCLQ